MEQQDFSDVLDAIPEGDAVKDLGELTHQLTMVVLDQAFKRNICPVRMKNREISPMQLAGQMAKLVEAELTKEVK